MNLCYIDVGNVPMSIWPDIVRWMIDTFAPGSWDMPDDTTLVTTEENYTLLMLRWA